MCWPSVLTFRLLAPFGAVNMCGWCFLVWWNCLLPSLVDTELPLHKPGATFYSKKFFALFTVARRWKAVSDLEHCVRIASLHHCIISVINMIIFTAIIGIVTFFNFQRSRKYFAQSKGIIQHKERRWLHTESLETWQHFREIMQEAVAAVGRLVRGQRRPAMGKFHLHYQLVCCLGFQNKEHSQRQTRDTSTKQRVLKCLWVFHVPKGLFFFASAFRPVWPGRCIWNLVCVPRPTRALDQEGVEPRLAVSLRPKGHWQYHYTTDAPMCMDKGQPPHWHLHSTHSWMLYFARRTLRFALWRRAGHTTLRAAAAAVRALSGPTFPTCFGKWLCLRPKHLRLTLGSVPWILHVTKSTVTN